MFLSLVIISVYEIHRCYGITIVFQRITKIINIYADALISSGVRRSVGATDLGELVALLACAAGPSRKGEPIAILACKPM